MIRAIQPTAEIIETNYCDVALDKILNTHSFSFDAVAGSSAWLQGVEGDVEMENEEEGEAYEYGIDTFVYYQRKPFNLGHFFVFIK